MKLATLHEKLDGLGLVDNRPSVDKLQKLKKKKQEEKHVASDIWHVYMTHDTWHMTHDMW